MREQSLVADAHSDLVVDILRRRQDGEAGVLHAHHIEALRSWNVGFLMLSTGGDGPTQNLGSGDPLLCTLVRISALLDDVAECSDDITLCMTTAGIERAIAAGRIAAMLMIEGASPLRGSLECLDIMYRLGIRSLQLTWNSRNEVGDGCGEAITKGGLTRFGRRLVEELYKKRVLLDLSHASESLFYSVCENAQGPFIVSHANSREICDHPRNLTDRQIKSLGEHEGLIGLCYFPWFIDPEEPSIERLIDHLDHVADLIGIDRICLGADFIYYARDVFAQELSSRGRDGMYAKGFDIPEELATPAGFAALMERMSARGYADSEIDKVCFLNLMDLYKKTID